jgi:hypothetical protein
MIVSAVACKIARVYHLHLATDQLYLAAISFYLAAISCNLLQSATGMSCNNQLKDPEISCILLANSLYLAAISCILLQSVVTCWHQLHNVSITCLFPQPADFCCNFLQFSRVQQLVVGLSSPFFMGSVFYVS